MQTVFITGCASGFGHALAVEMLERGHRVIATDPFPSKLADLAHSRALCRRLDLRDPDSIRTAVHAAMSWSPPDVLVNNGGYAYFATQEEADIDAVEEQFRVNVFGTGRVTQALLPHLRSVSGTVVQLSSVAGRCVFPESGWYAATKHALEAMTEALVQETATTGMKVRLIEPGSFDTGFLARALEVSPTPPATSPYAPERSRWMARKLELLEEPQDKAAVVDAIADSLDDPRPFYRIPVGPDSKRMVTLRELLGADRYTRLAAARNGAPDPTFDPDALLVSLEGPDREEHLDLARLAYAHGHLDHWADTESGLAALEHLDRL